MSVKKFSITLVSLSRYFICIYFVVEVECRWEINNKIINGIRPWSSSKLHMYVYISWPCIILLILLRNNLLLLTFKKKEVKIERDISCTYDHRLISFFLRGANMTRNFAVVVNEVINIRNLTAFLAWIHLHFAICERNFFFPSNKSSKLRKMIFFFLLLSLRSVHKREKDFYFYFPSLV